MQISILILSRGALPTYAYAAELDSRNSGRFLEAARYLARVHLRGRHHLPRRRLSLHLPLAEDQNCHRLD